ncbi:MAG TPA: hypothetical protein PK941_01725 [Paludibacter sp.]|nr:hypothetical protein [Paludibacter sp.]
MLNIYFLKKNKIIPKSLSELFVEKGNFNAGKEMENNIFYEPAKLLQACGFKDVLNEEPFKYIITPSRIWEFYLLRYINIGRRDYKKLTTAITIGQQPVEGCTRSAVGNPFDKWQSNYHLIKSRKLQEETLSFAKMLASRKCPIRQNGTLYFINRRKQAAKSFFKYLIGQTIHNKIFEKLKASRNSQSRLTILINNYPNNDLFITSGIMVCLYGGKNTDCIDSGLAHALLKAIKHKRGKDKNTDLNDVYNIIKIKANSNYFRPPYKDIYDVRFGNRERVNINFRIETWLKLLEDTFDASR